MKYTVNVRIVTRLKVEADSLEQAKELALDNLDVADLDDADCEVTSIKGEDGNYYLNKEKNMGSFELKERLVKEGKSKVFNTWRELVPSLTEEEFIENLKWVCDDPCANDDGTGRLTREIGLTKNGIVKIKRVNDAELTTLYRLDTHELWSGDFFTVPCTEKYIKNAEKVVKNGFADENGMIKTCYKLSLSGRDEV